jgi:hypothetical protein
MSFVIAMPEMVGTAATDLASIGSTLSAANVAAAAPTTGIVAAAEDEVSAAIAALFGEHGQAYQAMSAQAAAFHSEFVNLMNADAGAYLSTEIANAEQALTNAVGAPVQALLGGGASLGPGGGGVVSAVPGGGLLRGLLGGGGTTTGSLVGGLTGGSSGLLGGLTADTDLLARLTGSTSGLSGALGGLGSLGGNLNSILSGTPPGLPTAQNDFEISLIPGLLGVGTGGTGSTGIAGPYITLIENTIANLQSLGAGWLADPFPFLRQVIANQIGYAQLVATAVGDAAHSFQAGLADLPAAFQATSQAFAAGNYVGGLSDLGTGFEGLFTGTVGDLSPIFAIPGHISQNVSNVTTTLTDTSIVFASQLDTSNLPLSLSNSTITLNLGLPLALGLDAIGAPITTMLAFDASEAAFGSAVQSGNFAAALTALVDAPAVIANGFLNGHATLTLQQSFSENLAIPVTDQVTVGIPVTEQASLDIPLGGVLTPLAPVTAIVGPVTIGPATVGQFSVPIPPVVVGPFVTPLGTVGPFTITLPPLTVGPFTSPTDIIEPFLFTVQGTPIGGIIPALVNFAPQQLAHAIGAPA